MGAGSYNVNSCFEITMILLIFIRCYTAFSPYRGMVVQKITMGFEEKKIDLSYQ